MSEHLTAETAPCRTGSVSDTNSSFKAHQNVIVVSCAENMVDVFGGHWNEYMMRVKSTDESDRSERQRTGTWCRCDCNQVKKMEKWAYTPRRRYDHMNDSPLTEFGLESAELLGKAVAAACAERGTQVTSWYSAPELRCLQTASAMHAGTGWDRALCRFGILVNPALCDYYGDANSIPRFIDPSEMAKSGDNTVTLRSSTQVNVTEYNKALSKWAPFKSDPEDGRKEQYEDYQCRFHSGICNIYSRLVQHSEKGVAVLVLPMKNFLPGLLSFPGQQKSRWSRTLSFDDREYYGHELPKLAVAQLEGMQESQVMSVVKPWTPGLTCEALTPMLRSLL